MAEWISVKKELPPDNVKVWVNISCPELWGYNYIGVGWYNKDGWFDKNGEVRVLQWMERDMSLFEENNYERMD